MISKFEQLEELFLEINKNLNFKVDVFMIGGAALLHKKLKPSTKDVDLIVKFDKDYAEFKRTLLSIKFKAKTLSALYTHLELENQFERSDFLLDIFAKKVCGKLSLSDEMMKRAELFKEYSKLTVYFCALEDIFLFKTITERPTDEDDCSAIAQREIDWDAILKEIKNQIKLSKKEIWVTLINERLESLDEKNVKIPILNETQKLTLKYYDEHSL